MSTYKVLTHKIFIAISNDIKQYRRACSGHKDNKENLHILSFDKKKK